MSGCLGIDWGVVLNPTPKFVRFYILFVSRMSRDFSRIHPVDTPSYIDLGFSDREPPNLLIILSILWYHNFDRSNPIQPIANLKKSSDRTPHFGVK